MSILGKKVVTKRSYNTRVIIDNTLFVKAWMQYKTVGEVARHLDMSNSSVIAKASSLRRKGVKLPSKQGVRSEVEKLNQLIKNYKKD